MIAKNKRNYIRGEEVNDRKGEVMGRRPARASGGSPHYQLPKSSRNGGGERRGDSSPRKEGKSNSLALEGYFLRIESGRGESGLCRIGI